MTGLSHTASVSWKDSDGTTISSDANYTVNEGTASGSGAQNSTLTISTSKLQALGIISTFTCDVTSGKYPESEPASNTMALTTLIFGKFCKQNKNGISSIIE